MSLAPFHQNLVQNFNLSELKDLCLYLEVNYEELPGENRNDKARELLDYCKRHNLGKKLEIACSSQRPHASWEWPYAMVDEGQEMLLRFEWASEIVVNTDRLKTAKAINWVAISNNKTLENIQMKKVITQCLENGGYIRLILLHPGSPNCQFLADYSQEYKDASRVKSDILAALKIISSHYQEKGDIEVRFVKYPPPYRLMLVKQNLPDEKGFYMRLRWVAFSNHNDVPTVVASDSKDPHMKKFIKFMKDQFNEYWKLADREDIKSLISQYSE